LEQTNSYTYFTICSNCDLICNDDNTGYYKSTESGIFDPDEITNILGIDPFKKFKNGEPMPNHPSGRLYTFSRWNAEKSDVDRTDTGKQCLETIRNLKNKIPELLKIKSLYDVRFNIVIVPHIYDEEVYLYFGKEIIDFCYQTGTTIDVDMYVYNDCGEA
jgi:hypothetical protein